MRVFTRTNRGTCEARKRSAVSGQDRGPLLWGPGSCPPAHNALRLTRARPGSHLQQVLVAAHPALNLEPRQLRLQPGLVPLQQRSPAAPAPSKALPQQQLVHEHLGVGKERGTALSVRASNVTALSDHLPTQHRVRARRSAHDQMSGGPGSPARCLASRSRTLSPGLLAGPAPHPALLLLVHTTLLF